MPTKVLVFESDPAFAGELRSELGKLGCTITVVDDGNVGLQQAAADRPDLILLSIELPRMNGFSVCNKLKKDGTLKDVPLVIMSSESSDETFEQHKKLRTRAEDYVHKPIAFGELLRHIQSFVPLGASPPSESESGIVIDDDIEIGSSDYMTDDDGTQIAPRPPSGMPAVAQTTRGLETVDADVDAFADAAFGRLTGPDAAPAPVGAVAEARPIHNGAPEPSPAPPKHPTSPPAAARGLGVSQRPAPVKPPSGVDLAEYERVRQELAATRERAATAERQLVDAKAEAEKLHLEAGEAERLMREVDELKSRLAAGPPKAGVSSREFLDLREALNKKDKEILALREQSSRKDKEHVESQDKMLALERARADLDDRALAMERELAELKEKNEALAADKDLAKKASEDFRARFEKTRAEVEGKERALGELRARHEAELAAAEARAAALRGELDQTLANERAEHARVIDQVQEQRRADLEQSKRDREAALGEAREQAERERQEALAAQAAQLKQESDAKLAALHRGHQQELERTRADASRAASEAGAKHEAELAAARKEGEEQLARAYHEHEASATKLRADHEQALAALRADLEQQGAAALDALRGEHGEKVTALENDRDARLAAIEARTSRELGEANDKLAKADMDLSAARGELASLREEKETADATHQAALADAKTRLAEVTAMRDDLDRKHAAASERVTVLEAEGAALRQDLGETKQKLAGESSRADKATAKWEADRQSLDRAKDALAVALAQIEEAEGRPLS